MTLPDPDGWPVDSISSLRTDDILRERAESTPDRAGVIDADSDERWTFAEFSDRRVRPRAAGWKELAPQGRVGFLLDTGVGFAEAVFATGRRSRQFVPLNLRLDDETLREQIRRADIRTLVCNEDTEARAVSLAPAGGSVASLDPSDREGVRHLHAEVDADLAGSGKQTPDDDRLVMFTSGTTGRPKGVRLTTRNLVASANASAARLGVEPDDRWLVCLPMYHMGGLAPLIRSTLYGTTTVIQREFDPRATAAVMDEYDVTGVSLVPTMLDRLLDAGWSPPDSLRFVLLGGGPASEPLVERSLNGDVPVYPTYGTTETASQIATATPPEAGAHPGTVGRPLRNTAVTILDDEGDPVSTGETGELAVEGPTVTPGYLDADATAAAFGEYGLETGDLGYADADGRLWIVGRVDDAIVTGGETVHPSRVVDALREVDGVEDAAVVGIPDEEWGERVAALVVRSETGAAGDPSPSPQTVGDAVRDQLPAFAVPKTVAFADDLPRTPSGTVDRQAVARRIRESLD